MSELRHDPINNRWVIIAKNRAERPNEFERSLGQRISRRCPFCRASEELTPAPLAIFPNGCGEDWQVRVVPNKYPALRLEGNAPAEPIVGDPAPIPAFGAHEVIIESARHLACFSELNEQETLLTFRAYQSRLAVHRDTPHLNYAQVFKNAGPAAGASIEHVHSQLMALPMVPPPIRHEMAACENHYGRRKECFYCHMLQRELNSQARVVATSPHFAAFCPYVSRFPLETWILPRRHADRFDQVEDVELIDLARLIQRLVAATTAIVGRIAYNYLFRWAPFDTSRADHYHWRMELFPRMIGVAAFEWATDCYVNPIPPEEAAELLRANLTFPIGG